jgi:hypothetical protein
VFVRGKFIRLANGLHYKCFMILIYDCIAIDQCCKTTIYAYARSINYDRKVRFKLNRTFIIVNYDLNTFIVEAKIYLIPAGGTLQGTPLCPNRVRPEPI